MQALVVETAEQKNLAIQDARRRDRALFGVHLALMAFIVGVMLLAWVVYYMFFGPSDPTSGQAVMYFRAVGLGSLLAAVGGVIFVDSYRRYGPGLMYYPNPIAD